MRAGIGFVLLRTKPPTTNKSGFVFAHLVDISGNRLAIFTSPPA